MHGYFIYIAGPTGSNGTFGNWYAVKARAERAASNLATERPDWNTIQIHRGTMARFELLKRYGD